MSTENKQELTRWERWQHTYRLVIMNNETFEEVGSYKLSLLNVYIILSSIIVVVACLIIGVIVFTPIKRLIPGYGDVRVHSEIRIINQHLDSIEKVFAVHREYSENFRRIMTDSVQTATDVENEPIAIDTFEELIPVVEDDILRREVELENIRSAAQNASPAGFSPNDIALEKMYFSSPVSGEISAEFMPNKGHLGVDILAPRNTPIKSVMDGWVIMSDWTVETGNTIAIQHTNNIITLYKHNSMLLKKTGNFVRAGEAVAIIGNTGDLTDGPHLHFELWHKGKPMDPSDFISFN